VNRQATIVQQDRLPAEAPAVVQVSRWDRLKDPVGLLVCFAEHLADQASHLVIAGPDVEAVDDDPEGAKVFDDVRAALGRVPDAIRARVHLVSLPMDDLDENAAMVNALQRRADVIVQKSIAEGFGLTIAEAMWKQKPIVAGRVGGIQDQIVGGESGLLVDDPRDLAAVAAAIDELLADPSRASRIGRAAKERVLEEFLQIRRLLEYFEHIEELLRDTP
jgi:trehalose synthase